MERFVIFVLSYLPVFALIVGVVIFFIYAIRGKWREVEEVKPQEPSKNEAIINSSPNKVVLVGAGSAVSAYGGEEENPVKHLAGSYDNAFAEKYLTEETYSSTEI